METEELKKQILSNLKSEYDGEIIRLSLRNNKYIHLMDLINKDIGKKPKLVAINDYLNSAYCTYCNEMLYTWEKYCPGCGQKIDWDVKLYNE